MGRVYLEARFFNTIVWIIDYYVQHFYDESPIVFDERYMQAEQIKSKCHMLDSRGITLNETNVWHLKEIIYSVKEMLQNESLKHTKQQILRIDQLEQSLPQ